MKRKCLNVSYLLKICATGCVKLHKGDGSEYTSELSLCLFLDYSGILVNRKIWLVDPAIHVFQSVHRALDKQ